MKPILRPILAGALALGLVSQAGAQEAQVESTRLADDLYVLTGRGGALAAFTGEDGVVLVDDQFAPMTPAILAAIREFTDAPLKYVINTHWHFDHTGGNANMAGEGAVIVAHDLVRRRMSTDQLMAFDQREVPAAPPDALPVITFSESVSLHLNGENVRVVHVPGAHTDGDAIVHFPDSKVLHMGDAFWNGSYPRIDYDTGASVYGMMDALRTALALCDGDTRVIPGHGGLADCAGLSASLEMLETTTARAERLYAEGKSLEEMVALQPNADYDASWGLGYIKPDVYLRILYESVAARAP
ncbi:MAG: MBL fold metallo-hydrolase [Gammaproteobacteria bacterium]